ncbi:MAG: HAMP domain-containing sensor histidine kinase [Candidatus Limnocylindrales bacterium]|jgi:signal transduction histidine kinase
MEPGNDAIRSITHDMRNLLTAVRGHAELALRGLSSEDPVREDVAHCVVVSAAMFDLIDQLDGNDSSGSLIAVNLDNSVASMRRLLDALLPPSIELVLATGAAGTFVTISKLRVERIVLNLALNARDAMEDGGKLTISTQPVPDEAVQIVIADTGPGFSQEALEHLFEPGFTTKRGRGGSGHGLPAVAAFVDGIGGSIEVDSVAGEGATVRVTLPTADLGAPDADVSD